MLPGRWKARARTYDQIWDDFQAVRKQTIRRLSAFNDKDLNDPAALPLVKRPPVVGLDRRKLIRP